MPVPHFSRRTGTRFRHKNKMRSDFLASVAWTNSLDISVRKRKVNRSGDATRRRNNLCLQDYTRDRRLS